MVGVDKLLPRPNDVKLESPARASLHEPYGKLGGGESARTVIRWATLIWLRGMPVTLSVQSGSGSLTAGRTVISDTLTSVGYFVPPLAANKTTRTAEFGPLLTP